MRVLATFPGKFGDIMWGLPTVRAISEAIGEPVDFLVSPAYSSHLGLLRLQPYLRSAEAWPTWQVQQTAPMTPWSPFEETLHHEAQQVPAGYDAVVHLGYRAWPDRDLPRCVYAQTQREYPNLPMAPLDLDRPWITAPRQDCSQIAFGFSDEWFELKVGIALLIERDLAMTWVGGAHRWYFEAGFPIRDW